VIAVLYLGHAVIGLALLAARPLGRRARAVAVLAGSATGALLGAALYFVGDSEAVWRTTEVEAPAAALIAVAIACSWILLGGLDRGTGRVDTGCLVGIACSGLALFATNEWVVPASLFWVASSLALVSLTRGAVGAAPARLAVLVSDVATIAALAAHSLDQQTWRMPGEIEGWPYWVLLAAVAVRAGALPHLGVWAALRSPAGACGLPLLVAGGFALLLGPVAGPRVAAGLALLLVALGSCFWALMGKELLLGAVAAWPVSLTLGVALISTDAVTRAGIAAALAVTAVALWPYCLGRAEAERGLLLSFVPTTAGFGVIVAGALEAFGRATETTSVIEAAPWAAVAALLPAALASGVALGARMGRRLEPLNHEALPLAASWIVVGLSVSIGVLPEGFLDLETGSGATARTVWLHLAALAAGIGAAFLFAGRSGHWIPRRAEGRLLMGTLAVKPSFAAPLEWVSVALGLVAVGGVLWLTYEGLRVGFL
jgi:hypothetical protein